jgi:peptidoglycan/xylan/chitin deacetylase (PgdA/CDA1 family)
MLGMSYQLRENNDLDDFGLEDNNLDTKENHLMSKAYLTIDDVTTVNTPTIIDYLSEKGITPILFSIGQQIEAHWDEALYALKKGAIMGNHSYSHPHFSELTLSECFREIEKQEDVLNTLYQAAGVERKYKLMRFPYGDKGGKNKVDLQNYLKQNHFCRIDDSCIHFDWYKEGALDVDVDLLWTFDFAEYLMVENNGYTYESILHKIHDTNPPYGGALLEENSYHIILIHDHIETEKIMPNYFQKMIDDVIASGVEFIPPKFIG